MVAHSNKLRELMAYITRQSLVPKNQFLSFALKCNIYRVAKFSVSWPFANHESAGPSSLKHPRSETRPQPQSGAACADGRSKSWAHGQVRKCEVCSITRSSRTDCKSPQCRSRTAFHSKIANVLFTKSLLLNYSRYAILSGAR